jgi:chemotaxis protein methyltransferase CheR
MSYNTAVLDIPLEAPADVVSDPALLFLFYRIEQILGIRAGSDALIKLNEYIEHNCGSKFVENPAAYEYLLTSREQIYNISKFLTVNETYFFREGAHFFLLSDILPEFLKLGRPLQICSAAVSIGCEAYSIAMLLDHHIKKGLDFDFAIDAFDISAESIEIAKNARYTSNALRADSSSWNHLLDSYLIKDNDEYIVSHNIRKKVRFFPHNIMRGLEKQYDIIFFRNSLIYFSSKNRISVINNIAESLIKNGVLFMGVSETSSVNHPLLANRRASDIFYFQKTGTPYIYEQLESFNGQNKSDKNTDKNIIHKYKKQEKITEKTQLQPAKSAKKEIIFNCTEINDFLKAEDGKINAQKTLYNLLNENQSSPSGSSLCASVIYYLNMQDFDNANKIISHLENLNSGAFTKFMRGEYYFHIGNMQEAESYYKESTVKDKYFWPSFYRIAFISADGNPTRYEYKIKKAIESIDLVQNSKHENKFNYECFMGGFSPDYFRRILEKKLSK